MKPWLAFAVEKLDELRVLRDALDGEENAVEAELIAARTAVAARRASPRVHRADVGLRIARSVTSDDRRNSGFAKRQAAQRARFALPPLPTTTIGSFPQTAAIRAARAAFKRGEISTPPTTPRR